MKDSQDKLRTAGSRAGELRAVTAVGIAIVCAVYAWYVPATPNAEMIDHRLYRLTVEAMRDGAGYYESMDQAFDVVYGSDRGALIENVRAYRMPTSFYLFSLLPSEATVWYLFVVLAGVSGVVASYLVKRPPLGIAVTAYLLSLGMLQFEGGWSAQFMTTELWAVLPILGAVLMVQNGRWWPAAILALTAMLIRETAATVLIVGVVMAGLGRVPRKPWLSAFALGAAGYVLHARAALDHIEPGVGGGLLAEVVSVLSVPQMMGFGLPGMLVTGPVLWAFAVRYAVVEHRHWPITAAPLALPIAGLIIDREYWGILVVPFVVLWGVEGVIDLVAQRRRAGVVSAD
jgi:hypothetical protein